MNCKTHREPTQSLVHTLAHYKKKIEALLHTEIPELGNKTKLRDACEYALKTDGKRFRPALVFMVGDAIGLGADLTQSALAVEYLHTASLIADDLPCMDDDNERRNQPSLHIAFNESIALMASYALIATGYGCLAKNAQSLAQTSLAHAKNSDRICTLALENVSYNTGFFGATGGQFLDIYPPNLELTALCDVIHKKTVSLFEISFVLGWAFGGGDLHLLPLVKKAASHFGMAFQVADDISDMNQDKENGRMMNMAILCGPEQAKKFVHQEIMNYGALLKELKIETPQLCQLSSLIVHAH